MGKRMTEDVAEAMIAMWGALSDERADEALREILPAVESTGARKLLEAALYNEPQADTTMVLLLPIEHQLAS
jgi:hypothetical protein